MTSSYEGGNVIHGDELSELEIENIFSSPLVLRLSQLAPDLISLSRSLLFTYQWLDQNRYIENPCGARSNHFQLSFYQYRLS